MANEQPVRPGLNLGGAISEKLTEAIKNMDVLTVLQKMVATTPEDEESEDIREKLQGVMAQFNAMSKDEKDRFTTQIKEGLANKLSMRLQDPNFNLGGLEEAIGQAVMQKLYLVGAAILLVFILVVFFGYKLYKSIKDKEKKKEDKKKAKQMKKKK